MGVSSAAKNHHPNSQVFDISIDLAPISKCFDDDGRLKRTGIINPSRNVSSHLILQKKKGEELEMNRVEFFMFGAGNVWTASAHIITAVIGSGVLSLAWATAQLGWVAGPAVMLLFAFVTYYTSTLLAACYRHGDPITGKRNYTYMDAVHSNLGKKRKLPSLVLPI